MLDLLHERGFDDLDAAHLNVFQYPGPEAQGPRTGRPAAHQQTGSTTCSASSGASNVERRPDPSDRRSKRVAVTPRGASAIGVIREAVAEMETAWAHQLGPDRFDQLRGPCSS